MAFRFIFVGGCGRSGTTLVQKLLVSHSRIAGGAEFDYTEDIFLLYERMLKSQKTRQDVYYNSNELTWIYRTFYYSMFEKIGSVKPGISYVSEKTPRNIFVSDLLLKVFPDSVFINVVRDGRDVVVSHKDAAQRRYNITGTHSAEMKLYSYCNEWNKAINKYSEINQISDYSGRVFNIKFENLLSRPEKEISRMLGFLGLKMETHLLNPQDIDAEKEYGFKIDNIYYDKDMLNQPLNKDKIKRWERELNYPERLIAETLMAANLARMGYDVNNSSLVMQSMLIRQVWFMRAISKMARTFNPRKVIWYIKKVLKNPKKVYHKLFSKN